MPTRGTASRPLAVVIAAVYIVLLGTAVQQIVQNLAAARREQRRKPILRRLRGR